MNPTTSDYNFSWLCEDNVDARVSPKFKCNVTDGTVDSGKKIEVRYYETASNRYSESSQRIPPVRYFLKIQNSVAAPLKVELVFISVSIFNP